MGRRAPKTGRGLAAKRRGRGKLRPNARRARVGVRGRQRAWAAVCLRRAKDGARVGCKAAWTRQTAPKCASCTRGCARTTARMGGAMPAACAKDGARVGCKAAWTRQTAPKCASCTRGCARTTARMGGAMPAACAKDGARVGCKVACAVNCVQTRVMHGDAQDSAHGRRCAGGARPGFARRGMTGITRLCPLVAGSRAPGAARQRCSDGNCALSQKSAGLRLTLSMLKGVSYI